MFSQNLEIYQEWVSSLPEIIQWLAIFVLGMIPYIEVQTGSVTGILSGINPILSILLAMLGNFTIVLLCILLAEKLNNKFGKDKEELSPKRQKFNKNFEKYGVAGTAMLGWLILPSSIIGFLMVVTAKIPKKKAIFWMTVSILFWGMVVGIVISVLNVL